jgi:hypothetical protein
MGLFTFLKPKYNPKPDVTYSDSVQALHAGILFEDSGEFLGWDVPIEENQLYVKKGYRADRIIYEWGDRVILNGLKLPLSTILWKHKDDGKDVPVVEFSATKEDAEKYFKIILTHLERIFGTPKTIAEEPGNLLEWKVGIVKVTLHLYEQYHTDKLLFQIGRL